MSVPSTIEMLMHREWQNRAVSEIPKVMDLLEIACNDVIVAHHIQCWKTGLLGYEQMLVALCVHLARVNADLREHVCRPIDSIVVHQEKKTTF